MMRFISTSRNYFLPFWWLDFVDIGNGYSSKLTTATNEWTTNEPQEILQDSVEKPGAQFSNNK